MAPRKKKASVAANQAPVADAVMEPNEAKETVEEEELKCPGCTEDDSPDQNKDTWICCDACKTWYHWGQCAGIDTDPSSSDAITLEQVDKWYVALGQTLSRRKLTKS